MLRINKIRKITRSIAFVPSIVVFLFFVISVSMIYLDYSETGKALKSDYGWIRLKDPSTARTIVSVIAAGLISLTVFSFTMVMVVLNQAASQLSNRLLDMLTGKRFHQFIIGYYIGIIVFALTLLTSIRDIESGVYVPALSTYLLIVFTIIAVLLFVFFIHFITQSIKYSTIIKGVYNRTFNAMKKSCQMKMEPLPGKVTGGQALIADKTGIFESFNKEAIAEILKENNCVLSFSYPTGYFLLKGISFGTINFLDESTSDHVDEDLMAHISFANEVSVEENFYAGFRQLSEITVKALSPGINDTGTAIESLQQLFSLLAYRLIHHPHNQHCDKDGIARIITREISFDEIFRDTVLPVWDYGKNDRTISDVLKNLLEQLQQLKKNNTIADLLVEIKTRPLMDGV